MCPTAAANFECLESVGHRDVSPQWKELCVGFFSIPWRYSEARRHLIQCFSPFCSPHRRCGHLHRLLRLAVPIVTSLASRDAVKRPKRTPPRSCRLGRNHRQLAVTSGFPRCNPATAFPTEVEPPGGIACGYSLPLSPLSPPFSSVGVRGHGDSTQRKELCVVSIPECTEKRANGF